MGRSSCSLEQKLRKGLWSPEEDEKLFNYITRFGVGCWSSVPKQAGLQRCGKSCRLRWINYLRPDLKRGMFSQQEENLIIRLHEVLGNRWAQIAAQLPGRTDNEIKNFWNSSLKKKLRQQGIDPITHKPLIEIEDQEKKNGKEEASLQPSQSRKFLTTSTSVDIRQIMGFDNSSYHDTGLSETSKEILPSKPIFDPFPFFEFQSSFDQIGTTSNIIHQYTQSFRPFEQTHFASNSDFTYTSMPNLSSCDTDVSDNSNSGISTMFLNETKENSDFQMQNMMENAVSSWDSEIKLESTMFQFQPNEIKSEEMKLSSWEEEQQQAQSSEDFISFPSMLSEDITEVNFDLFAQI